MSGSEGGGVRTFHGRVEGGGDDDVLGRPGHGRGLVVGAGGQAMEPFSHGAEAGGDVFSGQGGQVRQGAQSESGEGLQQGAGVTSQAPEEQAGQERVQGPGGEEVGGPSRFDDDPLAGGQNRSGQGVGDTDLALDVGLLGDGLDEGCGEDIFSTSPGGGSFGSGQGQSGAGHDGVCQEGGQGLHDGFEGTGLAFLLGMQDDEPRAQGSGGAQAHARGDAGAASRGGGGEDSASADDGDGLGGRIR